MYTNAIGTVFGRYRLERSSTVAYAGTATAPSAYHGSSAATVNYGSTRTIEPPVIKHVEPLPAGWTRAIDPIKGVFVYERVVYTSGLRGYVQRQHTRPHSNVHAAGYVPAL